MSKTEDAARLSGAYSVQPNLSVRTRTLAPYGIWLSSKPFKVTGPAALVSTDCGHRISTCFPHRDLGQNCLASRDWTAEGDCPHVIMGKALERATEHIFRLAVPGLQRQVRREPVLARARSEDSWLKKRTFGGFCETAKPFEDRCPRIEASWPRPISGI